MFEGLTITVTTPLEAEHVATIRGVDPSLTLLYEPDLLAPPRYHADHTGPAGWARTPAQEERFLAMLARADVTYDFDRRYFPRFREVAPRLRWVQSTSAGIGQMVRAANIAPDDGIIFTTASGVHAQPLADFSLMAMLMFAKGYFAMEQNKRARQWSRYAGEELTDKTLAIVGLGRVGRLIAQRGREHGMRVVGMNRTGGAVEGVDHVYARAELHQMLAEADFVVLIVPHTDETEGIIGAAELAAMKPPAVFINIARGSLVDEDALVQALQTGRLRGAALDVFRQEPPPQESPLWDLPNVIMSPHSASTVAQENGRITALFCENLQRYMAGEPLLNVLDRALLY